MHHLVGRRRRHMDAGAEIRHQQELADVLFVALKTHQEAGHADLLAVQRGHHRRLLPGLPELVHHLHGARIVVLQAFHVELAEDGVGVPVGRHQVVKGDGAVTAGGLGGRLGEAVADGVVRLCLGLRIGAREGEPRRHGGQAEHGQCHQEFRFHVGLIGARSCRPRGNSDRRARRGSRWPAVRRPPRRPATPVRSDPRNGAQVAHRARPSTRARCRR